MQTQGNQIPSSFQEAKNKAIADPLGTKMKRVENLVNLEKTATDAANKGANAFELADIVNEGQNAIASVYPDIPEYEKAVSAASRFKSNRAADNPQDTIRDMPDFI